MASQGLIGICADDWIVPQTYDTEPSLSSEINDREREREVEGEIERKNEREKDR